MKKGQVGLGLVILGVITIIAIIGLVLLFTRASTTGESWYAGMTYNKPYVGETGGMSYDQAHYIIIGGGVEHIPQCRTIWGNRRSDKQIIPQDQIKCYVVEDKAQRGQTLRQYNLPLYQGRINSDVLCYLADIGHQTLDWYDSADRVCIPTRNRDIFPN